jgi:hypothetical protein
MITKEYSRNATAVWEIKIFDLLKLEFQKYYESFITKCSLKVLSNEN